MSFTKHHFALKNVTKNLKNICKKCLTKRYKISIIVCVGELNNVINYDWYLFLIIVRFRLYRNADALSHNHTRSDKMKILKQIDSFYWKMRIGIKNIFYYLPFIFKDRDYDDHFLYEMLYAKLNKMSKYYESGGTMPFVGWEREARYIKICKELAYRLSNRDYDSNADLRIPKEHQIDYENMNIFNMFVDSDTLGFKVFKHDTTKEQDYWILKSGKIAQDVQKNDKEYLFKLMNKHSNKWWD